jgi:molecular chaperone HtpG
LRGVVDSEGLPLNISRETLQANAQLETIKNAITKKILSELAKKKENNRDEYLTFWQNFGAALKEGLCEVTSDHEKLMEVCIFRSALHDKMISLDEYIANCKEEEKTIYYLSGDNPEKLKNSPQIEGFLSKGIDVLLFTDTVDDFWVSVNNNYKGVNIKSVTRADINLDNEEQKNDGESNKQDTENTQNANAELVTFFKKTLGHLVKDVKISKKLTSSPTCLAVGDGSMDIRMERFLIEQRQLSASSAKILEINPSHKIVIKMAKTLIDPLKEQENKELAYLLYDQACIIEGEPVQDVAAFAKRLNHFLEQI